MKKEEIIYERDMYASYIKVPACKEENIDETIFLKGNIKGVLPVECCFVNRERWYWYQISGKQALDQWVKVQSLEYALFERVILRLCEQIEVLEWHLLNHNGLQLNPELIFVSNGGEEISFLYYPKKEGNLFEELQKLMDYLLAKLDHSDSCFLQQAYDLYEMVTKEDYQISDLKEKILKQRLFQPKEVEVSNIKEERYYDLDKYPAQKSEEDTMHFMEKRLVDASNVDSNMDSNGSGNAGSGNASSEKGALFKDGNWKKTVTEICKNRFGKLFSHIEKKSQPNVIYPEYEEETTSITVHPTICLTSSQQQARGVLLYEGVGNLEDFEIGQELCWIGKSKTARMRIERDTISAIHAKIECREGFYYIEDMNSTNGTFVNDKMINYKEEQLLEAGDVVRFADVKYRFL